MLGYWIRNIYNILFDSGKGWVNCCFRFIKSYDIAACTSHPSMISIIGESR